MVNGTNFPAYPSYKHAEAEWLAQIPSHWSEPRLATLFSEVAENGSDDLPILSVSIHDGVSDKELDPDELDRNVTRSDDRSKYKRVSPGDLVYNMMRAWQGGFGTVQTVGMVSPAYVVARPTQPLLTAFVEHLLRTPAAVEEMRRHSRGVTDFRLRLYWDQFKNIKIALPPLTEQTAIAAFLDRETAKIDALVEEQKRLIELLREKRQAVISHAVTKGLNPDARVKDSGIEWLGEVPEHWATGKLRHLTRQIVDGAHFTPTYVADGVPFLRVTDITSPELDLSEVKRIPVEEHNELSKRCRPERGDLLLSKNGTIGVPKVVSWNWEFSIFVSLCLIKLTKELDAEYLAYVFQSRSIESQIEEGAKQSTVTNLHLEKISAFSVPLPPLTEQVEIAGWLNAEVRKLEQLIEEVTAATALLQERRSALISAAVTGKIDVRTDTVSIDTGQVRLVIGAELIRRLSHRPTFGRVKLQKLVYLAEAYAGVSELGGEYLREAAGPLDRELLADIESLLKHHENVAISQPDGPGGAVRYKVQGSKGNHASELDKVLGNRKSKFDLMVNSMADLDTKGSEAVATLFAVWNDAMIDCEAVTDEDIVSNFLTAWHTEKSQKFKAPELHTWLGWMRRHNIVPTGRGPKTSRGRLLV